MSTERADWIKLAPLSGVLYAEMLSEILKSEDIPNYIAQDWVSGSYGVKAATAVGNVAHIFVPPSKLEEARRIQEHFLSTSWEELQDGLSPAAFKQLAEALDKEDIPYYFHEVQGSDEDDEATAAEADVLVYVPQEHLATVQKLVSGL